MSDENQLQTTKPASEDLPSLNGSVELCGYRLQPDVPKLVPAPVRRDWIEQTGDRFATRCLPMMIANQAGWFVLNTVSVQVYWSGGNSRKDLVVEYAQAPPSNLPVVSVFGHGIVTWRIPILFRTPAHVQLLVRGPANQPKPDVFPLEGIVETSWSIATFTMNWKVLAPSKVIRFDKGEPICMLVPVRLADLERIVPVSKPIWADSALAKAYQEWARNRFEFMVNREPSAWEKDYMRGRVGGC